MFSRKEGDKIKGFYRIILKKYISRSLIRNIGFNDRFPIKIEKDKDRNNNKG